LDNERDFRRAELDVVDLKGIIVENGRGSRVVLRSER